MFECSQSHFTFIPVRRKEVLHWFKSFEFFNPIKRLPEAEVNKQSDAVWLGLGSLPFRGESITHSTHPIWTHPR
jgi:hypothetical protein